jgi:hypothetical protein
VVTADPLPEADGAKAGGTVQREASGILQERTPSSTAAPSSTLMGLVVVTIQFSRRTTNR